MGRRFRSMILVVTIILSGIAAFIWTSNNFQARAASPVVNSFAPDFALKNLDHESIALKNVYSSHKVTLLNFWATWCPPCRGEIPELNRLYDDYAAKPVEILGVNLQESRGSLREFVKENKMRFPVLMDSDGKVGQLYQVYYIPTTFVIDSSGKIRKVIQGGTTYNVLKKAVDDLLKEE